MKLADIQPAIQLVSGHLLVTGLRELTYLATYPAMIAIGAAIDVPNSVKFHQLATLVYGWMPRIVRIDPAHCASAIAAFDSAVAASQTNIGNASIKSIADCLHSVVGASKLLHFANPEVFPIWDRHIEIFRANPGSDVTSVPQYMDYMREVHSIRAEAGFPEFYDGFCAAYAARLKANGIMTYEISQVRAIEAAAFELVL